MSQVHDNIILSYEVDLQNDLIRLHTRYDYEQKQEATEIIFTGVLTHLFEHQLKGSIIFDIGESDISSFIKDNNALLLINQIYSWPKMYNTLDELEKDLVKERYKYIILMSSYGMNGWVLAKNYEINTRTIDK
jgi:hypothetical protein